MTDVQAEEGPNLMIPNLDITSPDLTGAQIKMMLANHALLLQRVADVINAQDQTITSLLYVLSGYMRQYPLDLDKLPLSDKEEDVTPLPGQYL